MTVYIPKTLLSEKAAQAAARLETLRNRLSSAHHQLMVGNYAHQKSMQETHLGQLIAAFESGPERGSAGAKRQLEEHRAKMADWDRERGTLWKALEAEIRALKAEEEQLELVLADYVGLRVEGGRG